MSLIFDKIIDFYQKEIPFVVYRKPNSDLISGFFQENDSLFFTENFTENGFVFAPFNDKEKAILIPETASEFVQEKVLIEDEFSLNTEFYSDELSKESHIKLVKKAIEEIHKNHFQKVVVSRKEKVVLYDVKIINIFKSLLLKYPTAMVTIFYHPKVGLWFGATPETLLKINDNSFETMSLAGTQLYKNNEKVTWKNKEIEEQQLVTDFIKNQLKEISTVHKIDETETLKAGNLLHLRTRVFGSFMKDKNPLKTFIKALHPTPAVCGLPRNETKKFIFENENYKRTFYTGFLGEINRNNKSELFVNLRCMEIKNNIASIFVGGGITKDSVPEKEWEETVAKTKTMKQVLSIKKPQTF